jgi:transcriptional regulator NrdR family protein
MICPGCGHQKFKVKYKINVPHQLAMVRRRECLKCETRFTTCETIKLNTQAKNEKQFIAKNK